MAWRIGKRSRGAKAVVGPDEVGGARRSQVRRALLIHAEVQVELNRHVRECERECSIGGWLGLIP
jgi:hypothetical protein